MTFTDRDGKFASERVTKFLAEVELMAAGDMKRRLAISDAHDELDAIAHGINVLVGELGWATARMIEAQEARAVAAEQANASKNVFLRNMSHELRTPVTAMLGFADLLASADLPEKQRELLGRLQANGLAVLQLLDELLDLARLDAHKVVLNPEPVSVFELAREVLATVEIDERAKRLQIQLEATDDQARGPLMTDRYRLRQILVNLVTNAVKFTPQGRVAVSLGVTHDREGDAWTIDIIDTGIGIPADRHAHLFEPFAQASDSIARVYGGNGLGLALSRRLAERLGGTLDLLHSAPGKGTAFRLTVRALEPRAETESVAADEATKPASHSIEGWHILLAEDHRDLNRALRAMLEQQGATVESAYDGHEAVAKATSATFDVVLMDVLMPRMDGLEAARVLRSRGSSIPIIALTADPASLHRPEALKSGCDACLTKPFTIEELTASIQLSSRQPAR
jgi:signal transduction histidine kinase/CheY-like chemotaxis protein